MKTNVKTLSRIRLTVTVIRLVAFLLSTTAAGQGMPEFETCPQMPGYNDPLERDPVIRQIRETACLPAIESEAGVERAAQAYERLSNLLGRIDARVGILAQSPEVLAEMHGRGETVSRYVAGADQHAMVVQLCEQMEARAVVSQGQDTLYSLYDAYYAEIRRIEERRIGLFRDMLVYLRDHRSIEAADGAAGEIMLRGNVARLCGRADAGGTDRLYADAADFLNKFFMPMLASARRGAPAGTPAEALGGLVEGLTAVADGLVRGR